MKLRSEEKVPDYLGIGGHFNGEPSLSKAGL
jgi:hypothetical protein